MNAKNSINDTDLQRRVALSKSGGRGIADILPIQIQQQLDELNKCQKEQEDAQDKLSIKRKLNLEEKQSETDNEKES